MNNLKEENKHQNIFLIADSLQKTYKNFVKSFQKFQNPQIQTWVDHQLENEELLYKEPLIELSYQFEKGKSLMDFIKEGLLDSSISKIYDIELYSHQSQAIEKIFKDKSNIIVSTGTGSGKSECFWIPIIQSCLEMKRDGLKGIKAIVIFPMNALANSQYHRVAKLLQGTGIKIGRYTGDTASSPEEAISRLEKNQNRKPYDSEVLSREEIRDNPPDILITNYVMLDLILTRFEDRVLFPDSHSVNLKYLVLDEIHTYTGNAGADVACLIRRLKQRTKTADNIRCIGTSATIQDNKKIGIASIIEFSEKIFGEKFDTNSLITASYVKQDIQEKDIIKIPDKITITSDDLTKFDGSIKTVYPLAEKILGRQLKSNEQTLSKLGEILTNHQIMIFIKNSLKEEAKSLKILTKEFKEEFRKTESEENCALELMAAFLVGSAVRITIENQERPLLVPKLHVFFTQGQEIYSCITKDDLHLSTNGDLICKDCHAPVFPLYFCRNCGHEFFSVLIDDKKIYPRVFYTEDQGEQAYLTPITAKNDSWEIPDDWLDDKDNIRKTYIDVEPKETIYCPKCNSIESNCSCKEALKVWKIPYPFQFCPSCGLHFTKIKGEYGKLFSFNSLGRSSSTDILTLETIRRLDDREKKLIIFTDNRQDTALQAEHLNDFQRRTNFRQYFYHTLVDICKNNKRVTDIEIGVEIYNYLEENNLLPDFHIASKKKFTTAQKPVTEFKEFLKYLALSDSIESTYFLDLNLEKLGILKIEYDALDMLSNDEMLTKIDLFNKLSIEQRYDYLRGILDIFRGSGAIANDIFINTKAKYEEWGIKFKDGIVFSINNNQFRRVGFTFDKPDKNNIYDDRGQRVIVKTISWHNTLLINWTQKFFNIKYKEADIYLRKAIEILEEAEFLTTFWTKDPTTVKLYQITLGKLVFNFNKERKYQRCPKCNRTYYFKVSNMCTRQKSPILIESEIDEEHFYTKLYSQFPTKESEIIAKEHSAQINGLEREQFENEFIDTSIGTTNVLVCTPTMELGIDIGELSAILMRNVPPDPSRYAQRSGRAGRKNQPSIVSVFCGTGFTKGPHDQYFYKEPEKIVSGKITPPNFLLDNRKLIQKHIHSIIISLLPIKFPLKMDNIIDLSNSDGYYPMLDIIKTPILNYINSNKELLVSIIIDTLKIEFKQFNWLDKDYIYTSINNFYTKLNEIIDNFRSIFKRLSEELDYLHNATKSRGQTYKDEKEYQAIQRKMTEMREGIRPFDSFSFLKNYGFLPNYAFPSDSTLLTMYNTIQSEYKDNWRSSVIAIREFAPHNQIYFLSNKYRVNKALIKTYQGIPLSLKLYICEHCNELLKDSDNSKIETLSKCPNCNHDINLANYKRSIQFPHMQSILREKINCDEENREVKGYEITINYQKRVSDLEEYSINDDKKIIGNITYEHNGQIFMVNKGSHFKSKTGTHTELKAFNFCSACGNWLTETDIEKHVEKCSKKGNQRNIIEDIWLYIIGNHDVITFTFPLIEEATQHEFYITLKEALVQSLLLTYNLEESELDCFLNPLPETSNMQIVIFETEEGGTGILKSLFDAQTDQFEKFLANLSLILHIDSIDPYKETKDACISGCYNCLLSFRNQVEHRFINRQLLIPLLKELANFKELKQISILDNTRANLEDLKDKCDSELERLVLEEIYNMSLPLPSKLHKTFYDRDIPIVKSDFFYEKGNIVVFVDGPVHEEKSIKETDTKKREFLESRGFSIVVLDFKDGKYIENKDLIISETKKLKDYFD